MDNYLEHFGVPGMKWGKRKKKTKSSTTYIPEKKILENIIEEQIIKEEIIPENKIITKDGKGYLLKKINGQDVYYISDMSNKGEKSDKFGFMTAKQVRNFERSEKVKKALKKIGSTKLAQAVKKYAEKGKSFISNIINKFSKKSIKHSGIDTNVDYISYILDKYYNN